MTRLALGKSIEYSLSEIELNGEPEDVASIHLNLGRSESDVLVDTPRASSLYASCMRMHCLAKVAGLVAREKLDIGTKITFGIGKAVHRWIQNSSEVFGDNKVGWWKCLACGETLSFSIRPSGECPKCNARNDAFEYEEHYVTTREPYMCGGHPDLFISCNNNPKIRVVEIKTKASDAFKKLVYPDIEHQWQLQYYMWACSSDGSIPMEVDPLVGYVLYVSKGALWNKLPLKMFPVKKDLNIIQHIKQKLRLYHECVNGESGYPPVRAKCEMKLKNEQPIYSCPIHIHCGWAYREGK